MGQRTTIARTPARIGPHLRALAERPALVPCLLAVVIFVGLAASEAGFYPIGTKQQPGLGWYPAGLLLLALLAATSIAAWPPRRPPRALSVALTLMAVYTVWSFLSITWADQQGVAWDGANRAAIYLCVLALFSLWPLSPRGALAVLGLLGVGIAGLGVVELLKVNSSGTPEQFFTDGRFAEPAGYINANVALWTLGLWPCLHFASARGVHPALRGAGLAGAVLLASLALMGQSRGWVFAVPLAIVVFVAISVDRARALTAVGLTALGALLCAGPVLAVHDDVRERSLDSLVAGATTRVLVVCLLFALLGAAVAVLERRLKVRAELERRADRLALAALGALLALGFCVFALAGGLGRLSDSWEQFKGGGEGASAGESRFTSVGTNRYDFWTVAVELFEEQPVRGIGSENFQQRYLSLGDSVEQPRYPHSLELGVLSQTGLIGAGLLAGALLAAAAAAAAGRRRGPPEAAAVAAVAATSFLYWLLHASIDWFWEFPGITAPAFAMLGIAAAVAATREGTAAALVPTAITDRLARVPGAARGLAGGLAVVAGALLALSLTAPWLAEREVDHATRIWPSSSKDAFDRLDRAERLNPLSPKPHLTAATIAVRLEDQDRAFRELGEVLEKEPRTPFALAELGALAYERGERARAIRLLRRARSASPRDEVVRKALSLVISGDSLDAESLNERYLRLVSRFDRE